MKKFNLNENIKVKLNDKGIQHYVNWYNSNMLLDKWKIDYKYVKDSIGEDGYRTFQMWHFMEVYGSELDMGFQDLYDLNILIDIK